jgi:hypothetical protein
MLIRVSGERFRARVGEQIEIVARSTNNLSIESAVFNYAAETLPTRPFLGSPSCSFTVLPGLQPFHAIVAFAPGAPENARYDLFETDGGSELQPLDISIGTGTRLIGFAVEGQFDAPRKEAKKKPVKKAAKEPDKKVVAKTAAKMSTKKAGAWKANAREAGAKSVSLTKANARTAGIKAARRAKTR